jgi:hypothetical protein
MNRILLFVALLILFTTLAHDVDADELKRLQYNNPSATTDLGVGLWAWPLPMDYDEDGDLDLVVCCPDKPYNGTYFFENTSGTSFPVFKKGVKIGRGIHDMQVSYVDGKPRVLTAGVEYLHFRKRGLDEESKIPAPIRFHTVVGKASNKTRARQWRYVDFDGDGNQDLCVAYGDWSEYGWDDAYDGNGNWTNGPLHGFVYILRNTGTNKAPQYAPPKRLTTVTGKAVDVYGRPSPNFADFDGDGDLDLLCGEFVDGFTYFQNVGSAQKPKYSAPVRLGVTMDLEMISPVAIDWDGDKDFDLIVGDEDGRVAFVENTGELKDGVPQFKSPRYFQQQADRLKCGALSTPCGFDWDHDGDEDIICGNTAGYIELFENLSGPKVEQPKWAPPTRLKAAGKTIRIMAGPNGSIQGPCESKWGYTTQTVADWDHDGLPDIVVNSIWGKIIWYRNVGTLAKPKLAAAQAIEVKWPNGPTKPSWFWWKPEGNSLATQWRTTPVIVDFNLDGINDLVLLDHEGYLCLYPRKRTDAGLVLLPPERVFADENGKALQLNKGKAGRSGRRKLVVVDWNGDGRLDVIVNSINADLMLNMGQKDGKWLLKNVGKMDDRLISSHTTSPTVVDFNGDGTPDLLIGAEDGHLYYKRHD